MTAPWYALLLAGVIDVTALTVLLWLYAQRPSRLRSPYAEKRTT